jgi:Rrf2 family protein
MKLSSACAYGLRALARLAAGDPNHAVTAHELAAAAGVPEGYLVKTLGPLVAAQLLCSATGTNGGYRLARPADQITVLEVVEMVDGPLRYVVPDVCVPGGGDLDEQLRRVCEVAAKRVRQRLRQMTLQDLAAKGE